MPNVHPSLQAVNEVAARLNERRQYRAAIALVRRAIYAMPNSPELWSNLGAFHWNANEYDEAEACLRRALALNPNYGIAWGNLGLVLKSSGRYDEAMAAFNTVTGDSTPEGARVLVSATWDRALLNLQLGHYESGWTDYEARLQRRPETYKCYPMPFWQGEDLTGKTIFVEYEQGMGDQIVMSRFLPLLAARAGHVYYCAPQLMVPLMWEFTRIPNFTFVPERVPLPEVDYASYLGSLPLYLREFVPPADPRLIRWRIETAGAECQVKLPQPELGDEVPTLKVGVCWTGNPVMERHQERDVPLAELLTLADDPRVWLYSLQVGAGMGDVARLGAEDLVCDLGPALVERGWVATGVIMQQLDLVVTCCTAVAHLAGALGVPCVVLLPYSAYWVWGCGDQSDWWPELELYRQETPGDWTPPIQRARERIASLFDTRRGG